jgi:hypothetical protein
LTRSTVSATLLRRQRIKPGHCGDRLPAGVSGCVGCSRPRS